VLRTLRALVRQEFRSLQLQYTLSIFCILTSQNIRQGLRILTQSLPGSEKQYNRGHELLTIIVHYVSIIVWGPDRSFGHELLSIIVHYVQILLSTLDPGSPAQRVPGSAFRILSGLTTVKAANTFVFAAYRLWTRQDSNPLPPQCK
jgi:hypothetical protein